MMSWNISMVRLEKLYHLNLSFFRKWPHPPPWGHPTPSRSTSVSLRSGDGKNPIFPITPTAVTLRVLCLLAVYLINPWVNLWGLENWIWCCKSIRRICLCWHFARLIPTQLTSKMKHSERKSLLLCMLPEHAVSILR